MQSPCQKLGYTEGQAFTLLTNEDGNLSAGDIVYLHYDDKTDCPEFRDTEEYDEDDTTTEFFELHKVAPVIEGKTPAQALGYKEGDLFIVIEDCEFEEDEIVELIHDDGTTCPQFALAKDDDRQEYPFLYQVKPLEPKVGRKARIRINRTAGHKPGTEGIITRLDSSSVTLEYNGVRMEHPIVDIITYAFAEGEEIPENEEVDWDITEVSRWNKGDLAIVRQTNGSHCFNKYDVITFNGDYDGGFGGFNNKEGTVQSVEFKTLERIPKPNGHNEVEFRVERNSEVVPIIRAIRRLTGWGLKESKDAFDKAKATDDWKTLGVFTEKDAWVFYAQVTDAKGDASLSETDEPLSNAKPVSNPATWDTKPRDEWKAGDKGIIRGQNEYDEHHFPIGSEVTFVEHTSSTRGRFEGNFFRSQTVELELVEPISIQQEILGQAARLIIGDEMASSQPRQVLYYQDGDSKEMTLIGYFQSKPVLGYIDRWDDPQVFIGKESLMTEIE
ncbi:hypothetical protein DNY80_22895 [Salmonella enterica subsp. enterica serovar Kentucky]|nr:hypothetical protein [Salmonella enterica subsp. enterica serovar Kentucky]